MERREVVYEELAIWFSADGSGFQVRAQSLEGECSEPFEISPQPADWQAHCAKIMDDLAKGGPVPIIPGDLPLRPRELGDLLFRALFRGSLRHLYERSRARFFSPPARGLRLRLYFDFTDRRLAELYQLPWELLYSRDTNDFLALSRLTPLVRSLEIPRSSCREPFRGPMKILLASANPAGTVPLRLDRERDRIGSAVREGGAEIRLLPDADVESLRVALGREEIHVLHFLGHGAFDHLSGDAYLRLMDGLDAEPSAILGEDLANLLRDRSVRLAVLNACETARSFGMPVPGALSGLAPVLVQLGLPAVVAMSQRISDSAASEFSLAFYRALVSGEPVEASLAEGRLAVYLANRDSLEWSIPVLFTRGATNDLFAEARPSIVAETDSTPDTVHVKVGTAELSDSQFIATVGESNKGSRSSAVKFEADNFKGSGISFIARKNG